MRVHSTARRLATWYVRRAPLPIVSIRHFRGLHQMKLIFIFYLSRDNINSVSLEQLNQASVGHGQLEVQ